MTAIRLVISTVRSRPRFRCFLELPPSTHAEDGRGFRWSGPERLAGHAATERRVEAVVPAIDIRSATRAPAGGDVFRNDELGAHEATRVDEQSAQHRRGCRERRGGDNSERLSGQPQGAHVGADHANGRTAVAVSKRGDTIRMELEGDHSSARAEKMV